MTSKAETGKSKTGNHSAGWGDYLNVKSQNGFLDRMTGVAGLSGRGGGYRRPSQTTLLVVKYLPSALSVSSVVKSSARLGFCFKNNAVVKNAIGRVVTAAAPDDVEVATHRTA